MSKESIEITGSVAYIKSENGKGVIFVMDEYVSNEYSDNEFKVVMDSTVSLISPMKGEIWKVKGELVDDELYGEQIIAISGEPLQPSGKQLQDYLARNPRYAGIGPSKAEDLWVAFGNRLYELLDNRDTKTIRKKVKIGKAILNNLYDMWEQDKEIIPVVKYCNDKGIETRVARKAREFWKEDTIDKIEDDPFRLLAFANWKKVNEIAANIPCKNKDEKRMLAAVEWAAYQHYDDQNTAVSEKVLLELVSRLLGKNGLEGKAIEKAIEAKRIVFNESVGLYQLLGAFTIEKYISSRLVNLSGKGQQSLFADNNPKYDENKLIQFQEEIGYELAPEQVDAIKLVVGNRFGVIVGGAGVGKTTVLNGIFNMLPKDTAIIQAAPTNRAASRMKESTGRDAITIHRLLSNAKKHGIQENTYLFIDEASMLDAPMFFRILRAVPETTRIYLVGDNHQLPPIGPGLILHLLVSQNHPNIVELKKVHRQAEETGIPKVSNEIRNQVVPKLDRFVSEQHGAKGVQFAKADKSEIVEEALAVYREFDYMGEVQIVAARNDTCITLNNRLHDDNVELLGMDDLKVKSLSAKEYELSENDKIIYVNNNDVDRNLFNGSIGKLIKIYDKPEVKNINDVDLKFVGLAEFDSCGEIEILESDLEYIDLGYAITVHKSQGSQWERVIIISEYLPADNWVVDNTWFYTAITRCQQQGVIVGSNKTFEVQVSSPPRAMSREVALMFDTEVLPDAA